MADNAFNPCSPARVAGKILAAQAVDQGPLFKESQISNGSIDAQISFAQMLNKDATKQVQAKVNIASYTKGNGTLGEAATQAERTVNLARTPEALLPNRVYAKIDKKMDQWRKIYQKEYAPKLKATAAKYDAQIAKAKGDAKKALEAKKENALAPLRAEAQKSYRREIVEQMGAAKQQIQDIFNNNATDPKAIDAQLKRVGLTRRDAYYTTQYLAYLENGGPFFRLNPGGGAHWADVIPQTVNNLVRNKSTWNIRTAAFHLFGAAQRAPAAFGLEHSINGLLDAHAAAQKAGVNIFQELPALARQGVYDTDLGPLIPHGKFDPLHAAQTFSDNVGYFVGKRAGSTAEGLKQIAYRPKPWNDTSAFQDPTGKNYLQFMSFQFRHMQQYGGWVKDAIRPGPNQVKAARALATYGVMTGILYGGKASIPAPVYYLLRAADPNIDKQAGGALHQIPIAGDFVNKGIVGSTTGLDFTTEAQPLGGVQVGLGGKMYQTAIDEGPKAKQAMKEAGQGHLGKMGAVAVDAAAHFSQLFKGGANATVEKSVDGVTHAYLHDANLPGYVKTVLQKHFGKEAVK